MNEKELRAAVERLVLCELAKTGQRYVPVMSSNRHVHLCQADVEKLFGAGYHLTKMRDLVQPGQFACNERVTIETEKGKMALRVVGPARKETQIELSFTDAVRLGLKPPIRMSGDLEGSPGCTLANGDKRVTVSRGVIVAERHLHLAPAEAEAFGITCPLITKADGTKFGKTESGNVWLDARYTSPYKFYQFWLNVSDEDAKRYIRIFTLLDRETVEALTAEHEAAPHLRILQKRLAQEITTMIHSREEYEKAVEASAILFGGSTSEALRKIDEGTLLQVFEGVPQFRIARTELGLPFVDLCAEKTQVFPSKGECRKMVQGGGVSLNKEKIADPARTVGEADLIAGKYLLVQRGKKNYYLVIAE